MYGNFYKEELYPLQDKVLQTLSGLETHFYLSGGTALSRCFLKHRFSDDLDFFVNDRADFKDELFKIQAELNRFYDIEIQRSGERFQRLMLQSDEVILKLEFINDVPFHFGGFESCEFFSRVDNPLNILSNKITAIMDRDEAKDFADIFSIVEYVKKIDWKSIFVSAASKSAGIFAPLAAEKLSNFDFNRFKQIKWASGYDYEKLKIIQMETVGAIVGL